MVARADRSGCIAAVEKTAKVLAGLGHHIEEATPKFDVEAFDNANVNLWSATLADWIMAFAEMLKLTPSPDNLEATIWACLQHGKKLSAIDLLTSEHVMNTVCRSVGAFFQDYDLLLTPTVAAPATPSGFLNANDPTLDASAWTRRIFTNMPFTALFNVTGQPAISLPLCMSDDGLPVGLQFVGHYGDEARLIQIAAQLEQAMPWIDRRPTVCAGRP